MSLIKSKLFQILSGDNNFCNFCLKNIEEISFSLYDEVMLENKVSLKIVDLITSCLDAKYITVDASRIICKQCTSMLLDTYRFTKMCRDNTEQLYKLLQNLEDNLPDNIEETDTRNSLFFVINPVNESNKLFYDDTKYENIKGALERLQLLISNIQIYSNSNIKIELEEKEYSGDSESSDINLESETTDKAIKVKQNAKEVKKNKIPLSEIIHDINNMSVIKCKMCHNVYNNIYRLKQHFLRVHAPKDFQCKECSKSYGSASLLTQHQYDSHCSLVCSDCGKSYTSRSTFKTHMEGHKLNLICQACGKLFKNKRNIDHHIKLKICDFSTRKKSLNKSFICDYCSKGYSSKHSLRTHIKFEHGDGAVHMCSWCNKKFNAISRLNAHIVKHTQEKKFSCDVCDGRFVTKASLLNHTRIHTGERPYQCEYCEQRFLSSSRRAEHVRRRHKDPMMECDICYSKFRKQSYLMRHKNLHFNPNSRLHYSRLDYKFKKRIIY